MICYVAIIWWVVWTRTLISNWGMSHALTMYLLHIIYLTISLAFRLLIGVTMLVIRNPFPGSRFLGARDSCCCGLLLLSAAATKIKLTPVGRSFSPSGRRLQRKWPGPSVLALAAGKQASSMTARLVIGMEGEQAEPRRGEQQPGKLSWCLMCPVYDYTESAEQWEALID